MWVRMLLIVLLVCMCCNVIVISWELDVVMFWDIVVFELYLFVLRNSCEENFIFVIIRGWVMNGVMFLKFVVRLCLSFGSCFGWVWGYRVLMLLLFLLFCLCVFLVDCLL